MRIFPLATAAAIGFTLLTTGCSTVDKAQACIEANRVITETASKVAGLVNDPKAMEKALEDGSAKLQDVADKAGNTTLNDALGDLAKRFEDFNVKDANDAVDAAQKVAGDAAKTVETVARECT
ncbi:hypothetical protein Sme01_09320 [Sphaerisporangium melleum]|nr:hypothetical protein [Sphaerisporangium melleum]GII68456.1 hypothetical protein Sme01_09320 [Sphaerisporangium melleum]